MRMQPGDYTQVIYDRGCLRSGEEWVERNLVPVAAVAVALAVLQASNKLQLFFFRTPFILFVVLHSFSFFTATYFFLFVLLVLIAMLFFFLCSFSPYLCNVSMVI